MQITELTIHGAFLPVITSIDIQKLPRTLSILRIYDCQVERLEPNAFEYLGNYLREIDLGHNVISSIPPNLFSYIKRLQKIVLRNNRITTLNRGAFLGLNSLQSLDLSQNQLTQMPLDLPNQIQQLYLTNNPIARLDYLLLENLQTLNLCGTLIDEFPSGSQIKSAKLEVLCLGGRTLKSTSTGFSYLNQLTELTLIGESSLSESNMPHPVLSSLENCRNLQRLAIEKYRLPSLSVMKNFEQLHSLVLREV
jgi:Leucine-rich repeat (LRR) protein